MHYSTIPTNSRQQRMSGMYTDIGVQGAAASDTSGHQLISMLFDGLLGAIHRARGAMQAKDVETKSRAIGQAVRILGEGLRASLNLAQGGAIASDLDNLYAYIELRLTRANLHNDEAALDECVRLLKPVQDAWNQIAPQVQRAA